MPQARELDPSLSALAFFGSELRRFRTAANLTQDGLGQIIRYTGALVGLVETAKRTPTQDFAERCDDALHTEGALSRLWPLVNRGSFPSWFRGFVELEAAATEIRSFQNHLIPGLLQTEEYIRAVLRLRPSRYSAAQVDDLIAARLSRQALLTQPLPPLCWFILDEAVLRRPVGSTTVMRMQFARLLELVDSPHTFVQVVPFSAGAYPGLDGALTMLSFAEGPDVAYMEGHANSALLIQSVEQVTECNLGFDLIRAVALSPHLSADMIKTALEEL